MKKIAWIVFVAGILIFSSCNKKSPTETPPVNNIHPQVDIPWPSLADSPWPSPRGNIQCNGRSKSIGFREGKVAWTFTEDRFVNEISGVVVGSDSTIYFTAGLTGGIQKRYLYALNPDGTLKWKNELEGRFAATTTPIVGAGDIIYVPTYWGPIHAFNSDGTLKWKYGNVIRNRTFSPALGLDGTIYFADTDGKLYAINANGTLKWFNNEKMNSEEALLSSYSLTMSPDGTVLYGSSFDSTLNAFDSQTGDILWEFPTGHKLFASPMVDSDGNIYFTQFDSTGFHLCSINSQGELRWKNDHNLSYWISFHMDKHGNIYVYSEDKRILSFDFEGNLRWSSSILGNTWFNSIIGDSEGVIYFAHTDSYILALNQQGNQIFECTLPSLSDGLIMGAVANSRLYLSGRYQFFCIE